jgi:hypothetical protein
VPSSHCTPFVVRQILTDFDSPVLPAFRLTVRVMVLPTGGFGSEVVIEVVVVCALPTLMLRVLLVEGK